MQTETNHALEQAKSQAASIVEMVRALDRETAAEDYSLKLTREQCVSVLTDLCGIECRDEESIDELREAVAVNVGDGTCEPPDFEFNEEEARERILEDPLSVDVRSGWVASKEDMEPEEFCILLCTGGPAVRIVGELDRGEPSRAWIEYQDWFKPWTQLFGEIEQDTLLTYCRQFYFGE